MSSSLKEKIKDLGISTKKPKDFDPEDDPFSRGGQDSDSDDTSNDEKEVGGREHYEQVGRSSLRKPKELELDKKKYGGQVVSRSALNGNDEEEHDPFAPVSDEEDEDPFTVKNGNANDREDEEQEVDEIDGNSLNADDIDGGAEDDDEIDSDEAFEEGEEEDFKKKGFVFRGSGKDTRQTVVNGGEDVDEDEEMDDSDDSGNSLGESPEDDSDLDMEDLDEDEEDSQDEEEFSAKPRPKSLVSASTTDREKLKNLISSDAAAIATSLSQAASSDAKKGKAVRKQCQTFDRLLDARIKLQKGLTSANDLDPASSMSDDEAQTALQKAEEAALRLYSTIESLRHSMLEAPSTSANKKRKRPPPATTSTPASDLWSQITNLESQSLPTRRITLDKWSTKTRSTAPILSSKFDTTQSQAQTKLSTILDTYLLSETPKLLTQSTTPLQPTATTTTDPTIQASASTSAPLPYNDTNFYQSLLRDLITSRSRTTTTLASATNQPSLLPLKLHTSGNTSKKDTKASKGRKIRYTVHEKLENFMAATGAANGRSGQWSDAAVREFFGSLMGGSGVLDEGEGDVQDGMEDDGEGGERREAEALRLFRS